MTEISISNYLPGEEKEILDLVRTCFDEFVSTDCTKAGIIFFYEFIDIEVFRKRNQFETFTYIAKNNLGLIVGMIEVKNDGHICLLFVHKDYQSKAIGYHLFKKAKDYFMKYGKDKVKMTVNSSIYAFDIYKKYGFTAVSNQKTLNGINFIEMEFSSNKCLF